MKCKRGILAVLALVLSTGVAVGQNYSVDNLDVYKYSQPEGNLVPVPDVDKAFHGDVGFPTCWQAAAANVLAAAGYGLGAPVGATPQMRADYIYTTLTTDLGKLNPGYCEQAINYWLYTYAKNPGSPKGAGLPNPDYQPNILYTDVTVKRQPLMLGGANSDYNFLLDELARCQYVNVSFDLGTTEGHCMTLVGGNKWNNPNGRPDGNISVWHDNCGDMPDVVVTVDDDVYTNALGVAGVWTLPTFSTPPASANGYVVLCPGLNKPVYAVNNYDVAYYRSDPDQNGVWNPVFRVAGLKNYGAPLWYDCCTVRIWNEEDPLLQKEIWLLVDYTDRVPNRQNLENILLSVMDPSGLIVNLAPTSVTSSDDNGQLLFSWELSWQPMWENIIFPDGDYFNLYDPTGFGPLSNVKDWDVATICTIPEPATVTLLLLGGTALLLRRRRR